MRSNSTAARPRSRRAAALVEFAIIAFAIYLILAAILTFGRAIFAAQVLQQTADVFARELSRTPLPPGETLQTLFREPSGAQPLTPGEQSVRDTLFDEQRLDINITDWQRNDGGLTLMQYLEQQKVPLVNRLLVPLMILDQRGDQTWLWYPGATLVDGHYYVYTLRGTGVQELPVVDWIPGDADQPAGAADPFPVGYDAGSGLTTGGLSQVRINYPFQSASLSAFRQAKPAGEYVDAPTAPSNVSAPGGRGGLYGDFGGGDHLGQQYVAGKVVRPFQRMISAQAVYRREAFSP